MKLGLVKILKGATGMMLVAFFVYCAAFLRAGDLVVISSKLLEEERTVSIYLPSGYQPEKHYPVLYSLDGEKWRHGAIMAANVRLMTALGYHRPAIVVAVHTEGKRGRDYVSANGGTIFLEFLERELIPWVDDRYNTTQRRILSGHSLGGLFTLFTLAHKPGLFQAYYAYDPSLLRDDVLLPALNKTLNTDGTKKKSLYVNYGFHTERYQRRMEQLSAMLDANDMYATVRYFPLPHSLIMLPGQLDALSGVQ